MAEYADDLLGGKREAIINKYDPRGHYRLGNGKKAFLSQDQIRAGYLGKWNPPISFVWRDLSFEAIGSDAVIVTGLFDWETSSGEKRTFSYTSLLLFQNGAWKIRLEDESRALPPPTVKP
ncbi:MAG: nuclear transport factor 2 family protein [Holophagaceae bacterium]|nr:nuclear transport factor 2 family protein [Holophagaceae bacterium]